MSYKLNKHFLNKFREFCLGVGFLLSFLPLKKPGNNKCNVWNNIRNKVMFLKKLHRTLGCLQPYCWLPVNFPRIGQVC